jgi:hypothetical protein
MPYKEIIAIYSKIHKKHINAEYFTVKPGYTNRNHYALKV